MTFYNFHKLADISFTYKFKKKFWNLNIVVWFPLFILFVEVYFTQSTLNESEMDQKE